MPPLTRLAMAVIRLGRLLFANTSVERLGVTTWLFRAVWRWASPAPATVIPFRGARLLAPVGDVTIAPGLVGGYYERLELDIFECLAQRSRRVLDVGGNIGVYACLGGLRLAPGGSLITFEPVPELLAYLRQNIRAHDLEGCVTVEPTAVGDADGETTLHLADRSLGRHSMSRRNTGGSRGCLVVPVTSLDRYLGGTGGGPVDLLKVDVEGYDGHVLRGAGQLLADDPPTLMVEFIPAQLRYCDFPPEEFVERVCAAYPDVFLIDEPRRALTRPGRAGLCRLGRGRGRYNLVATARPDHLAIIRQLDDGGVVTSAGSPGKPPSRRARGR